MTALDIHNLGEGESDIRTPHIMQLLPRVFRHVTERNAEGKSIFLSTDDDDHHQRDLANKSAIATVIYSTIPHRVELNDDVDIEYAHEDEVRTSSTP